MINVEKINDALVISFTENSKLNVTVTQKIKSEVINVITPNSKVVLNLNGVNYIDSTGFGMLLSILRHCKNSGSKLKICNVSPEVMELIKLLQLQTVFDIKDSVDDCIKSF
ncbi:MAG: anti-sigma factor antagonist [Tenuifilum sp.]|jgi:anti-sigma B factor antagonist|uniref:Anti-sigma factor antagonist n=1 Tax=Tenuifilum thalassicum TaxID=2590900 RepID=A0A7D3XF52_9BACT|nr:MULTISPECIES: STAS domain-containing protein [Tenuifilum]MDI3527562.1 anti-sigma factor antagonist [Tenuifilum sp.]QKG80507.1 STAS domain-containing protein [Tenuifilum thalassicum]